MTRAAAALAVLLAGTAFAAVPTELRRWPGWRVLSPMAQNRLAANYARWTTLSEERRAELTRRHDRLHRLDVAERRQLLRGWRDRVRPEVSRPADGKPNRVERPSKPERPERPTRPERPQKPERPHHRGGHP